jgi:lipoprotein-anchoring transpeptidase ErfK/SrfK
MFLALLAAGCGGTRSGVMGAVREKCAPPPLRSANASLGAVVTRPLSAFRTPGRGAIARFGLLNVNGVDTVFSVLGQTCDASWLHVELPLRPNGATGWVRADHVRQFPVRTLIVVDVSARTVRFFRGGKLVLHTTAAVGSSATPTPIGRYYVNQRLIPSDPTGPFGPGAIGISAFSPVLTGWAQGGPVAIHGTDEPWSIGRAVSNGCIRVPNTVVKRMFARTPAGTPVIIKP